MVATTKVTNEITGTEAVMMKDTRATTATEVTTTRATKRKNTPDMGTMRDTKEDTNTEAVTMSTRAVISEVRPITNHAERRRIVLVPLYNEESLHRFGVQS